MRRFLFAVVLCLATSSLLATQPNPSQRQRELIDQLITLTSSEQTQRRMVDTMLAQMQRSVLARAGVGESSEDAKFFFERFRKLVDERIDFKQFVRELYLDVYTKYFTEDELAEIVARYRSPLGQKMLQLMPQIMADSMRLGEEKLAPTMNEILEQVKKDAARQKPWKQTMADMTMVATAVESYATDYNKYPETSDWDQLGKMLVPTYIKELPEKDGWGNPYAYVASADGGHYRIVSSGADSNFEWDSRRVVAPAEGQDAPATRLAERLEDDLIYADGAWVQKPKVAVTR